MMDQMTKQELIERQYIVKTKVQNILAISTSLVKDVNRYNTT